jgi:hypothetical protein
MDFAIFFYHGWVLVHPRWLAPHSNSCNSSNYLKIFTVALTPLLYSSCEYIIIIIIISMSGK